MSNPFDLGGMGGLGGLMAGFQQQLKRVQEEAGAAVFVAEAGSGLVKVEITGKQVVQKVEISDDAMDDKELLEDLIVAAVNKAQERAAQHMQEQMSALTAGLPIPPGMLGF